MTEVTISADLLANVIRAAYLAGWQLGQDSPNASIEHANRRSKAYALGRLTKADVSAEGVRFMALADPSEMPPGGVPL